ncbi:MAG: hypothetical protein AAFY31_06075, partial [Pseudomonadota bacterium]
VANLVADQPAFDESHAFGNIVFAMIPPPAEPLSDMPLARRATSLDAVHAGLLMFYVGVVATALPRPRRARYRAASAMSLTR